MCASYYIYSNTHKRMFCFCESKLLKQSRERYGSQGLGAAIGGKMASETSGRSSARMKLSSHGVSMEVLFRQLGFGLLLLLLLASQRATAVAVPSPQCQTQCGGVEIPFPFGIGANCSLAGFSVSCLVRDGVSKPFLGGGKFELLNISLIHGTLRKTNNISTYCYNTSSRSMDTKPWSFSARNSPFRFSDIHNKFTVVGCNTLAYISDDTGTGYQSGCVSTCRNLSDLVAGSCSGMGCCQTAIPRGMDFYNVSFDSGFDTSRISSFGPCGYAVLMEAETFSFSPSYINQFNSTNNGRTPVIMDWAIRENSMSCEVARLNKTGTYACLSRNSECMDSTNGPGYRCNCSNGYQGNPYLFDGCQDYNECIDRSSCPSGSTCHNTIGGYRCSCRAGRKFSQQNKTCDPDTGLIIGVTVGFLALVIFSFLSYFIIQRRKLNKIKQGHFRQHGGVLLFERIRSENGLAFKVFTETELIQATNNYDKTRIIGRGGHGTVYKGILKDNTPIAIKRCALIDERQKKEFGQEMLILSQINHKNIVKLVGCCLEVEVPMLVYEFIPNGTLYELIHGRLIHGRNRALQVSFSSLLRIAHEAAEGLSFLHSYASPPILHGDVKTANILLDDNYMAKVSDFGASILAPSDNEQYVTVVQGTCGYLDPEYMQTCKLTDKSDVYSFGVILLEVLTGQVPLKLNGPEEQRSLTSNFLTAMKENKLDAVVARHIKRQESTELVTGLAALAKQCLDMCGNNRPSMKEIVNELGRLLKLSLHPWAQLDAETETESFLGGPSTSSIEIEVTTTSPYPSQDGENLPTNPMSSYYGR